MIDLLSSSWLIYIPIGIVGFIRWTAWLIRRVPAAFYRPIVNDHREPLSVVVPVYDEDPVIFAYAIESWLASGVDDVVLVIDVTDKRSQEVA